MAHWLSRSESHDARNTKEAAGHNGLVSGCFWTKRNVYAELQRHFDREEEARNQIVVEVARSNHLPLLATNGVCHAVASRREVSDVFTCIRNHVRLETAGRLLARNSERYLKSAATMEKLFADLPEAIANTPELSSRLNLPSKTSVMNFRSIQCLQAKL